MSLITNVAERIPEVISEVTGNELVIAPNIITPAGDAIQALPAAQALIGLVCIVCLSLTVLSLRKTSTFNQLRI